MIQFSILELLQRLRPLLTVYQLNTSYVEGSSEPAGDVRGADGSPEAFDERRY